MIRSMVGSTCAHEGRRELDQITGKAFSLTSVLWLECAGQRESRIKNEHEGGVRLRLAVMNR
jgi:hypothetical protein